MTLALTVDCVFSLARESTTKCLEKEEGTKTPNTSSTKALKFHVLHEHSSRTEMKGIANVLYEACNFKHSVKDDSIAFSIAA